MCYKSVNVYLQGELELINRPDGGGVLLRSVHTKHFLTVGLDDQNTVSFCYKAEDPKCVRKAAEFELIAAPLIDKQKGACHIYSSDVQRYLSEEITANESDVSKAAVFIFEPRLSINIIWLKTKNQKAKANGKR